ncbi:phage BR0599 family protein [Pasteurella multocida]|uniref:phage BR0599 family protein n=1 Tax=Pasteurella multocida TaxID=747 RepID=UPI00292F603E|nr:phage BR0599 family protein [Pasteurella multocida]WNY75978.1 phage BR0599 family protein [Pasteurella multocida]
MSYLAKTLSIAEGQPVNLYEFVRGDNEKVYRFCDADIDLTINGQLWQAVTISDAGKTDGENTTITVASNNPIAKLFRGVPPSQAIGVKIYRTHWLDNEIRVVWIGTVIEVKRPNIEKAEIISASLSATMNATGLRLTWGRNCPYSLYDHDCKVKRQNFAVHDLTIEAIDGANITLNLPQSIPSQWFRAGFVEWIDIDGVKESRAVTVHQYNQLSLMGGTKGLNVGMKVTVYPGCDGRIITCATKFNNVLNFGGIPHMPNKSPYDGSRVF